jgi:hypothetical protein
MTYELLTCLFIGFIVGALLNRSKEDKEQERIYEERYKKFDEDLHYYKKLTKQLADENAEFRRKQ